MDIKSGRCTQERPAIIGGRLNSGLRALGKSKWVLSANHITGSGSPILASGGIWQYRHCLLIEERLILAILRHLWPIINSKASIGLIETWFISYFRLNTAKDVIARPSSMARTGLACSRDHRLPSFDGVCIEHLDRQEDGQISCSIGGAIVEVSRTYPNDIQTPQTQFYARCHRIHAKLRSVK